MSVFTDQLSNSKGNVPFQCIFFFIILVLTAMTFMIIQEMFRGRISIATASEVCD